MGCVWTEAHLLEWSSVKTQKMYNIRCIQAMVYDCFDSILVVAKAVHMTFTLLACQSASFWCSVACMLSLKK